MIACYFLPRVSQCPCSEVPQQMEKECLKWLKGWRDIHIRAEALVSRFSDSGANPQPSSFIKRHIRGAFIHPEIILTDAVQSCHMVNLSVERVLCQLIRIALDVRMYGPICTFVFIHPTMYMPCTVTLWSRFYYQVNERIIPTKTSSRTCWSINLNQHSVIIIFLNDEGRRVTFGQC